MKLNLGCGNNVKTGRAWINHDRIQHREDIDVTHDLDILPWPWRDGQFTHVLAISVLEHLRINLVQSLDECWRILEPHGELYVKLPHWNSDVSHQDPTHRWFFIPKVLDYFVPATKLGKRYPFYTVCKWEYKRRPVMNKSGSSFNAVLRKMP